MLKRIIASPFFIFPVAACLVFWPFTLHLFTVKNDALTYYYPIRTLISDALRNGELPLWTPFINMGYPLHADMQSGAWNPVIWVFAFLSNYSLAAFHYEFLLYISFSGIGFYFLCRDQGYSKWVAISVGFAFQFCGFMVDSVQFFNCISSACYLPFVFLYFRRMMHASSIRNAATFAFFLYLLFTGGYPSLFIILCYILLAYGIFSLFGGDSKIHFMKIKTPAILIAAMVFVLLALPAIISFARHLPTIDRGGRQSLETVLENSMNPTTSLSLLLPFATTAGDSWLHSSILMRSIYMGIIPLIFMTGIFFKKHLLQKRETQFFLGASIVLIGLAWGEHFFLRSLAYHTLPLMDSFRHPALFRLFAIFFLLLTAGLSMQYWLTNQQNFNLVLKRLIYFLLGLLMICTTWCFLHVDGNAFANLLHSPGPATFAQLPFANRLLLQLPFVILILVFSYVAITQKRSINWIVAIVFADMFVATQLNMPVTIIGAKTFHEVEQTLLRNPVKFPLPGNTSISENSANSLDKQLLTGSKIPFTKRIGRNDYYITPGNLRTQELFYNSPIRASVFKNPVLYFADTILTTREGVGNSIGAIAFSDSMQGTFLVQNAEVIVSRLTANSITATTLNSNNGLLVFLQNDYPGWKAYIDEKPADLLPVNLTFIAIKTTAGAHSVQFRYEPKFIQTAFCISLSTLILLLLYFVVPLFSKYQRAKHLRGK